MLFKAHTNRLISWNTDLKQMHSTVLTYLTGSRSRAMHRMVTHTDTTEPKKSQNWRVS